MRIRWTAMVAVAVMALSGTAFAETSGSNGTSPTKNASKLCKQLKASMGAEAFKAAYGTNANRSNAHGKCVSKHRAAVKAAIAEATEQCKAELAAAGNNDKKALRECVKAKLAASLADRREAFDSAADKCRAERKADAAAFREKYGTNANKRNAFGKCVSKTARAELEAQSQA
jgi:hypothetical protein